MTSFYISTSLTFLLLVGGTATAQVYPGGGAPTPTGPPVAPGPSAPEAPPGPPAPPAYPPAPPAYPPAYPPAQQAPGTGVVQRDGFVVGGSLGLGRLSDSCNGCGSYNGGAGELHLGFMVMPKLAILVEAYVVTHSESQFDLTQSIGMVAAQYWAAPKLWLRGGLGSGVATISDKQGNSGRSDGRGAFMIAGGYEVYQSGTFAADVALHIARIGYDNSDAVDLFAITVGANWY